MYATKQLIKQLNKQHYNSRAYFFFIFHTDLIIDITKKLSQRHIIEVVINYRSVNKLNLLFIEDPHKSGRFEGDNIVIK